MNSVVLLVLVMAIITALWLKGYLSFGSMFSLYKRIRLAALLWAAAMVTIGLLRIFGIVGGGF